MLSTSAARERCIRALAQPIVTVALTSVGVERGRQVVWFSPIHVVACKQIFRTWFASFALFISSPRDEFYRHRGEYIRVTRGLSEDRSQNVTYQQIYRNLTSSFLPVRSVRFAVFAGRTRVSSGIRSKSRGKWRVSISAYLSSSVLHQTRFFGKVFVCLTSFLYEQREHCFHVLYVWLKRWKKMPTYILLKYYHFLLQNGYWPTREGWRGVCRREDSNVKTLRAWCQQANIQHRSARWHGGLRHNIGREADSRDREIRGFELQSAVRSRYSVEVFERKSLSVHARVHTLFSRASLRLFRPARRLWIRRPGTVHDRSVRSIVRLLRLCGR